MFRVGLGVLLAGSVIVPTLADQTVDPAAAAVTRWFETSLSLGCFSRGGADVVPCGQDHERHIAIFYGNAGRGTGKPDAIAIIGYYPDLMGNGENSAAAYFHRENGEFQLVKPFLDFGGLAVLTGSPVRIAHDKVTMTIVFFKESDQHCCPTGHKQVTLTLR